LNADEGNHNVQTRPKPTESLTHRTALITKIGERSANLFLTRQLWCSGAVLVALNKALHGQLPQDLAIRLCAGLGDGMGGSGCLCGGLSGGALALGVFLGSGRLSPGGDQTVLKATHQLHHRFKEIHGSTCCRILTKNVVMGSSRQFTACAQRTATAAELASDLILQHRPELLNTVDWDYLHQKDGAISARLNIVADRLKN
jgi:C_GCAxxG_C_C family probable redox protein